MRTPAVRFGMLMVFALSLLLTAVYGWAAPGPEQKAKLKKANEEITKATALIKNQKFKDAGEVVQSAGVTLTELSADKDLSKVVEPLMAKVKQMRSDLELNGVKLDPLPTAEAPAKGGTPAVTAGATAKGAISFTKQVFPMLNQKCAKCHIRDSKGGFGFNTFAALEKGSKDGVVILPGKGESSRIVEVIKSGDMPRGGGKVTPDELAMLIKWINDGAKYDGGDKTKPIDSTASTATPGKPDMTEPRLTLTRPTGGETVSFSRDIAPVLAAKCVECHGDNMPRGNLNLDRFTRILLPGASGNCLVPGKSSTSLLIKKIMGKAGERMPEKKPALPDDVIAKFAKWVDEGAKFDGDDPGQEMKMVSNIYKAKVATHEELQPERLKRAGDTWFKGNPDVTARKVESKNFVVMGTASDSQLKTISDTAEQLAVNMSKIFRVPAEEPLIKGRMTIFVFTKRYDYKEFGQMVEDRKLPDSSRAHWFYDAIDAFGAVLTDADNPPTNGMLAEQIAAVYVSSLGNHVPKWFAEGVGRVTAASIDSKDGRAKAWDDGIGRAVSNMSNADSLLKMQMNPEDAGIAAYGMVKFLRQSSGAGYTSLLGALKQGQDFDAAFSKSFKATPEQACAAFSKRTK